MLNVTPSRNPSSEGGTFSHIYFKSYKYNKNNLENIIFAA